MEGTNDYRGCDRTDGPFLRPAGGETVVEGREVTAFGARRGMDQLGKNPSAGVDFPAGSGRDSPVTYQEGETRCACRPSAMVGALPATWLPCGRTPVLSTRGADDTPSR